MGRKRKTETGLPTRVFFKHGAYFYVFSIGKKQEWVKIGTNKEEAENIGSSINKLKREKRLELLSVMRNVEESVRAEVFERDGFKCVYCGATSNLVMDHFIPYSMGGSSYPLNIVTCCVACNSSKGGRDPRDFILDIMGMRAEILSIYLSRI